MNDLDLEDLESRLYCQIYHGKTDETEQNLTAEPTPTNLSKPTNNMRRSGCRYFGPWSPGAKFQNKNAIPKSNHTRSPMHKDLNRSDGFYSKDSGRSYKPDVSINEVVSPSKPIPVCMNSKQSRKAFWKAKLLEKKKQKQNKKQQRQAQVLKEVTDTVITLSDSDEDSCVVVENKCPVLSVVDSDVKKQKISLEEKFEDSKNNITLKNETPKNVMNQSLSDDVIFIEPAPIEVIILDEEFVSHEESFLDNTITNSPKKNKARQLHQERKELLRTPDSASNDFMNNSGLELNQHNFNFSLHGSDFNREFLKPAARNETCETESSSSTTDANSVNLMKTVVFNEVDFPRDDIFSENNLETFGNFITPLRRSATMTIVQSSPIAVIEDQNQNKNQNDYSSDSSSESELEESQVEKQKDVTQKVRNLPELSPMQRNKEANVSQPTKKTKKTSSMCSKFDLLNPESPTSSTKDVKQKNAPKKKKRNKKKKNSECGAADNNSELIEAELSQNDQVGLDDQLKQKKRRSSQLEDFSASENQPKKKNVSIGKEDAFFQKAETVESVESRNINTKDVENKKTQFAKNKDAEVESGQVNFEKKITEQTHKESNETVLSQNTLDGKSCSKLDNTQNSTFDGLIVVDEVNLEASMILSSDSESVLSALHEDQDIQINCEDENDKTVVPSEENKDFANFNIKSAQLQMSNDPKLWKIVESDRSPRGRSKGRRCNKCRQFGHMAIRCPNKVEVKCTLCGGSGHYEPRCPNKICTQCGQRSSYSTTYCNSCFKFRNHVCQLCLVVGHNSKSCPDLWRRYHLTTSEGPLTKYEGPVLKAKSQLWCSGCAQSGHLEHSCGFYKSIYPASDPFIKSYEDIYLEKETNVDRVCEQEPSPSQNYGINTKYFVGAINQTNSVGYNYNQNNYGQINHQLVNPYMDGIFVPYQQNFFTPGPANIFQIPQNSYPMNHDQLVFENPLPTFISFETQDATTDYQVPDVPDPEIVEDRYFNVDVKTQSKVTRRHNVMFFSSSGLQLQHFLNEELHRLSKLSLLSNKVVKEFRKRPVPSRNNNEKEEYYETLNMLLFGIYNLIDGKLHLERLKKFKRERLKSRVGGSTRRRLHASYCYIFGRDKHYGVDYKDLLRRI